MNCCFRGYRVRSSTGTVVDSLIKAMEKQLDKKYHPSLKLMKSSTSMSSSSTSTRSDKSVFFVGAGASVESGLPNFRDFSEHMLMQLLSLDHGVSIQDLAMFVSELRPEVLLQTLHEVYGGQIFDFYDWFNGAKPSTNHFILARVLREGGLVLTTNIDVLIELAYEELYGERDFEVLLTKEDFENFSVDTWENTSPSKGVMMKFHGTVDMTKTGLQKYDTVKFLLDQVGKGVATGMHQVLKDVCQKFHMVYLGYSGCDNFSVQPVLCNTTTDRTSLWMWYEWRKDMILEDSPEIYERDMKEIGNLVSEGKSFSDLSRGMETISTCEILSERTNALRLRGKIPDIMNATTNADDNVVVEPVDSEGPIPEWTKSISTIDRVRCAAKLYSRANDTDKAVTFYEEANRMAASEGNELDKAQTLKELGNEYAKASTSESYAKAIDCYNLAIDIFDALNNTVKTMETTLDKVNVLRRTRCFDEAEELLETLNVSPEDKDHQQVICRQGLMHGLILGMGRRDKESRDKALPILEKAAVIAEAGGHVGLKAAILNASGLIKYQMAGNSIEILQSGAKDLEAAFRLNIYIGDARSCFQQMRNVGLIHSKLSRLMDAPELLDQAIEEFKKGEKFLFRLSRNRIMGELLEIRFRLGESLVAAERFNEAAPILSNVREERVKLDDWHNEARTLELLLKCALTDAKELIERTHQVRNIYQDALTNQAKKDRFAKVPITAANGKQILKTAADLVKNEDVKLSVELEELSTELFGKE